MTLMEMESESLVLLEIEFVISLSFQENDSSDARLTAFIVSYKLKRILGKLSFHPL